MKHLRIYHLLFMFLILVGCSENKKTEEKPSALLETLNNDMENYLSSDVNAIEQALPQIMIIPSDQTLDAFYCLDKKTIDGKTYYIRNYKEYLTKDTRAKSIFSFIQSKFIERGYMLDDLERSLNNFDTQEALDMASNLETDARTALLTTIKPDIILELDYKSPPARGSYKEKELTYTLTAFDAYTSKSVATVSGNKIKSADVIDQMKIEMTRQLPTLMGEMQNYFSDLLTKGRQVSITINVAEGSNQNLQDSSIEGDTYADQIIDFIKVNCVKGAYKMQINTKNKLVISNARIKLLNDDGTQYSVYDYARDLQKYLKSKLGLLSDNNSQGLGNIVLTIKGM